MQNKAHGALQGHAPGPRYWPYRCFECDINSDGRARARNGSVRCVTQIIRVIRHMLRERRWWHLPRYTFGSSSGGVIALELPLRFPFQARRGSPDVVGSAFKEIVLMWLHGLCNVRVQGQER